MTGHITFHHDAASRIASVVLANPGKMNAIDIGMWRTLRECFERLQTLPPAQAPHAVIVSGAESPNLDPIARHSESAHTGHATVRPCGIHVV